MWLRTSILYGSLVSSTNSPLFTFVQCEKISSYFDIWTFEESFQTAMPTSRRMRAGVAHGGIISPVLFRPYVNSMPSPSRHVELALYAYGTAVNHRCSFNIWRHLSNVESGWEDVGSPSISRRILWCPTVRPVGPSRKPGQFGSSWSQCKCLLSHIIIVHYHTPENIMVALHPEHPGQESG
jgi:hypothetical protein